MLVVLLILVSLALVVTLGILIFGQRNAEPVAAAKSSTALVDSTAQKALEAELDKRRKELDEQRTQIGELKGELKQAKRKLFELKEATRDEHDLVKARTDVERNASIQLEQVRAELASALGEIAKLREAAEKGGRRERPAPAAPAPAPVVAPPAPVAAAPAAAAEPAPEKPAKKARELTDADREKMERLEHLANKERARAADLDRDVKRLKSKVETQNRIYVVTKGELDLVKDKFKALEKRLNRTLLEKDLMQRALKDLAEKSGVVAGRTELTTEEIAASDKKVDERIAAEAAQVKTAEAQAVPAPAMESEPETPKQEQV